MMRTLQHEEMLLLRNVEIKKIIKNDFKRGSDCQFKPTDGVFHPYHLPEGEPAAAQTSIRASHYLNTPLLDEKFHGNLCEIRNEVVKEETKLSKISIALLCSNVELKIRETLSVAIFKWRHFIRTECCNSPTSNQPVFLGRKSKLLEMKIKG
ncbi:hypothetical protein OUZ56_004743 [Daphnia magna]|uniref:Uncharacterized protein n=1 Tax=Daphnia magna TaxID=35525 RepID=A0ABQ9YQY6_9CRUS|nr:hypothetical protein OUZ56_004743 [Daphnia magna]